MNLLLRSPLTATLLAAAAISASPSYAQLDASAQARRESLRQPPASVGTLIYRGATFAQHAPTQPALFHYERRVSTSAQGITATHATSDGAGDVIITESARFSPSYALQRFDVANQQSGYSGSVVVSADGHQLEYRLNDKGKLSTASEDIGDPVVSGPSLFGFILSHWDGLQGGKTIPVRMIVLKEKTTYGFDLRFEAQHNGQTSFSITPSSFIIRLAVAPLRLVFDTATRHAIRYEGRVPPMEVVGGKLRDLNARVEYTSISPSYR